MRIDPVARDVREPAAPRASQLGNAHCGQTALLPLDARFESKHSTTICSLGWPIQTHRRRIQDPRVDASAARTSRSPTRTR
jgi:hypothetical protein